MRGSVEPGGGSVAGDETVDGHTVTFAVSEDLASDATFVVTVTAAEDPGRGLVMQVPYTWTFTTGDVGAPQVVDKAPPADAVDVALGSTVVVEFDEPARGVEGPAGEGGEVESGMAGVLYVRHTSYYYFAAQRVAMEYSAKVWGAVMRPTVG